VIEKVLPDFLIRLFAGPYVAGDSMEAALQVARSLASGGIATTMDLLAEGITREEEVQEDLALYERLIEAVGKDTSFPPALRPSISMKPSNFTTSPLDRGPGNDAKGSREHIFHLAGLARERGVEITVDMEDRHWTDFTLDLLEDLWEGGYRNVGGVLQTRLKRTDRDLDRIPEGMRVRLVLGIYKEPPEVAYTDKASMKRRMLEFGEELLRRGHYVEFGTHDEALIEAFLGKTVAKAGKGPEDCEIQMLYGVPRRKIIGRILSGELLSRDGKVPMVRIYTPFATSWPKATAYCRRRLAENPHMAVYVLGNLAARFTGRQKATQAG